MSSTCTSLLQDFERWAKQSTGLDNYCIYVRGVRIKMNRGEGGYDSNAVVSYLHGELNYQQKERVFSGDLQQLFSDRRRADNQPFDTKKADVLRLEVFVDGRIRFTLKSWNNYSSSFQGKCENGLMFGFDQDRLYWVLDFAKTCYSV